MKKLQVASFLLFIITILFNTKIDASTLDANNYTLQLQSTQQNSDLYYTGVISNNLPANKPDRTVLTQDGSGQIHLANSGNTFSNGIAISGNTAPNDLVCIGYPPAGFTTPITASGNSYMGSSRIIRFSTNTGGSSIGGILELGCDMSAANTTLQANTTGGATIRGYNQTSAYTIKFTSYLASSQAGGSISVGTGATVIFGFALPVGSGTTYYSAFNMSGTSTNPGILRLFNSASPSTAPININAYGVLDCSLCTTTLANATGTGLGSTLTVYANGTLRFPGVTGNWSKPIVLSP